MKFLSLTIMSLFSFCILAQGNPSLDLRIEKRLEFLVDQIQRNQAHRTLNVNDKMEVLRNIENAARLLRGPNQPPTIPAFCSWFDGQSQGIAVRGWHAIRVINGINLSVGYYNNNSVTSQRDCQRDIIFNLERNEYSALLSQAAATTCACTWYDGASLSIPERGWHMSYSVRMYNNALVTLSSAYFLNNGVASQQECNKQLIQNNFVCSIR